MAHSRAFLKKVFWHFAPKPHPGSDTGPTPGRDFQAKQKPPPPLQPAAQALGGGGPCQGTPHSRAPRSAPPDPREGGGRGAEGRGRVRQPGTGTRGPLGQQWQESQYEELEEELSAGKILHPLAGPKSDPSRTPPPRPPFYHQNLCVTRVSSKIYRISKSSGFCRGKMFLRCPQGPGFSSSFLTWGEGVVGGHCYFYVSFKAKTINI